MVLACDELFECIDGVKSVEDFKSSVKTRRAAAMCLLDLGELFKSLGDEELNEYPSDHWQNIIGFRNRSAVQIPKRETKANRRVICSATFLYWEG